MMNRLWMFYALVVAVAGQGFNTRDGIIAPDLGVDPVPGGTSGVGDLALPPGCFCVPINQQCPFVNVRVVFRPVPERCPDMRECCNPDAPNVPMLAPPGTCGRQNAIRRNQITHGPALFGEFPWMAMVLNSRNQYIGGGALLSSEWVLTAAHRITSRSIQVRLGELDFSNPQDSPLFPHKDVPVDNIIIHPDFDSKTLANNVALLHLAQPVELNQRPNIGRACLPSQGQLFQGAKCIISGWGGDSSIPGNAFQNRLRAVELPIVESFTCQARLRAARLGDTFTLDQTSFVCAGGVEGNDACTGDGGSPLMCQGSEGWTVVGLVAWGLGCGQREVPGVYVNVASYTNFIRQYVRN